MIRFVLAVAVDLAVAVVVLAWSMTVLLVERAAECLVHAFSPHTE